MPRQIAVNTAAIATGHPLGADAGVEMLRAGGNAVDAAVAAMIALSVVIPGSVGLGGYGGSAVIYRAGNAKSATGHSQSCGSVVAVDFDSCAPRAFRDGMITADPESNYYGARAVTVPAVVAGLDLILREFGTKSWREVSQPAIRLAEAGFEFDSEHKRYLDRCAPKFDRQSLRALFSAGVLPDVGDRWQQPDMAKLLSRLADEGPQSFYDGDVAQAIVGYLGQRGGILSERDFRAYRPQVVNPLCATVTGPHHAGAVQLFTPPPPSGGITSLAIVQTVERFNPAGMEPWSAQYFHVLAEAMKLCWRERQEFLGDPAFMDVPCERLLSEPAAAARADEIQFGRIAGRAQAADQSPHTANVVVADGEGNVISITATQGWMYGAHLVVEGLGLVLNHGMSRFDYTPGHPNAPAPGKRMQHNMSPTIALDDGRPALAIGLPGGPKIVTATAQLLINAIAFGATPAESIAAPRLHTDGDEPLLVSDHMRPNVVAELKELGHQVRHEQDMGGPVNVIAIDARCEMIGAASGEGTGAVAGL
jgi:gamma-glutamyltranspeptidase/glutathione hydrolase